MRPGGFWRSSVLALLAYAAITLALTWPLSVRAASVVPHDLGDPLMSIWTLWWNAHVPPLTTAWWDGPIFYPARDTLSLSDHRLGLGLIATPLIWSGASPLLAYNVCFLLSYFLSAAAAYALCASVTRHRLAAFVGGLVYGFHPFRAEHLAHVELLSSYWLPIVLLALHRWADTRRTRWLALMTVALTLQAFTSGYYFFFGLVLLGGWLVWFRPRDASGADYARLAAAFAVSAIAVTPVLLHYRQAHQVMELTRSIVEIEYFSADLSGFITAPAALAFWNTPLSWYRPEGALFPGLTAVALVLFVASRRLVTSPQGDAWPPARRVVAALALASAAVALVPLVATPSAVEISGVAISVSRAYKPLSIAALLGVIALAMGPGIRRAWRRQSPFAFYALATVAMWVFALGPTARVFGYRALYKAPYAWLMTLPGFADSFRAPARFAMLAALTLSVAAAIASVRLLAAGRQRIGQVAMAAICAGILLDGWMAPLPLMSPPPLLQMPSGVPADAAIVELPLGIYEDAAAMYRAMGHGHPIANGLSGHFPPRYQALRDALRDGRVEALATLAVDRPLAVFVSRDGAGAATTAAILSRTPARLLAATPTHDVILLAALPTGP